MRLASRLGRGWKCSERPYYRSDDIIRKRFAREDILAAARIAVSIEQKPNRFRGRDDSRSTAPLNYFRNGWNSEIFSAADFIAFGATACFH